MWGYLSFVAVVLLFMRWAKARREEILILHHQSNQVWERCKHAKAFAKGYHPPSWLGIGTTFFRGSWHTLMHNVVRYQSSFPTIKYDRELFRLKDGGTVALDWAMSSSFDDEMYLSPEKDDDRYPIVFMHHGLCGSSDSHYIQNIVHDLLHQKKYRIVCLVARGCGGVPLTTPQGFTAARTQDMREALNHIASRFQAPMFGVGYSLGAGLMAKYVGEEGVKSKLSTACVISPCWDFMHRSPWFSLWSAHFLAKSLVDYTKEHLQAFVKCKRIRLDDALNAKYVTDYDAATVVPLHGYKDVDDYYQSCSPITFAHNISVPTLSISAEDDPVCSVKGCPQDIAEFGEGLVVVRTKRGGHVCWAEGTTGYNSWMDRAILTWIDACHENHRLVVMRTVLELSSRKTELPREQVKSAGALIQANNLLEKSGESRAKDSKESATLVDTESSSWRSVSDNAVKVAIGASAVGFSLYKLANDKRRSLLF